MVKILSVLLVLLFAAPVLGQTAVMSNDYWLSYLPSIDNTAPIWVLISTNNEGTAIRVRYSEDGSEDRFVVSPNKPKEYRIKVDLASADQHQMAKPTIPDVIQQRSIHITSDHPISVQQFTDADNNVSLSLPIPTGFLGRKYVISAFNDQHPSLSSGFEADTFPRTSGEYIIIAAQDSTVVTINAVGKHTSGLGTGQSTTIKLKKGETYWGKGLADTSTNDISGTIISSNRPVSVTAGCEIVRSYDAMRLQNRFDYNDHIAEHMIPVEQWGTEYIGAPLTNKRGTKEDDLWGDLYRIYAAEETELFMDGNSRGVGKYWELPLQTVPRRFTAAKPIMVAQYDYYIDFHGINPKNPRTSNTMHMLLPRHQWSKKLTCMAPRGFAQTYFYVTAHRDSIDKITAILPGKVQPVPISGLKYNGAQVYNIGDYRIYTLVLGVQGQVHFSGPCDFQVLNHGSRDNDAIKATYSYASITGSTFGRMTSSDFLVKLDSSCGEFKLTIQDTAVDGDGFADIILLRDPYRGDSKNTKLTIAPHVVDARSISATVNVLDGLSNAFGAVLIRTRAGKEKIVTMLYKAPIISPTKSHSFANVVFGDTATVDLSITNVDAVPVFVTEVRLLRDVAFSIEPLTTLPRMLAPGDTLKVRVSYSPEDTGTVHWDSIVVVLDCISKSLSRIEGFSRVATIYAEDQDFNLVDVGEVKSESIAIRNLSPHLELTLTGFQIPSGDFTISESDSLRFPIILARYPEPGHQTSIQFNYQPLSEGKDTLVVIWKTDIHSRFADSNRKEWSTLVGEAVLPLSVDANESVSGIAVSNGIITLNLRESEVVTLIQLSDLVGKTYRLSTAMPVSLQDLTAGVYFLRAVTNQRTITQKIIR
jgi:hypothetical protein